MAATVQTTTVQAADGRELCLEIANPGGSPTVLLCAGQPNSRHIEDGWVREAEARGIQLVGYDRPGYGGSTPRPGRTVAEGADDLRAILDGLGVDRALLWGFSGGGPYVLAGAARLGDRIAAAGTVGSPAPLGAPGLDYFAGMGEDNVESANDVLAGPEQGRARIHQDWEQMMGLTGGELAEAWKTLLAPVDAALVTGEFADWIVWALQDGLAPGDQGWWDDEAATLRQPWGFELGEIRIPVKVWHGAQDRFVPVQHGRWLAEHIPGAESGLSESDGHLSLLVDIGYVHEWLLSHF